MAFVALAILGFRMSASVPAHAADCSADGAIDTEEDQMLLLINTDRAANGVPALALSDTLNLAAAWKSRDMADHNYFAHDDIPIGRTWTERLRDCGYTYNTLLAEDIAAGFEDAASTFEQWRNSPSHNAVLLNEDLRAIGIGRAYNPNSDSGWYWTIDLGGVSDGYTPPPGSGPGGPGDVTCSGTVNANDAQFILQSIAGVIELLPCPDAADVNLDGKVDSVDAVLILQFAAGLLISLPP
ncbi:MAG: CAP domain-containing protein [Dehalococcoidia bacterium]|nr:CAP domain-containing protein [Dehalococcoidia bacterium]